METHRSNSAGGPSSELPRLLEAGRPRGEADLAVVLLHGRDRTKKEMLRLAAEIGLDRIRWIAPAADLGKWYPHRYMDPLVANEPYLSGAIERCDRVIDDATEGGRLSPAQVALIGFSQGACIAAEYVLRHPGRCNTIIVLTGSLMGPAGTDWKARAGGSLAGTRILITGSDVDEWVSEERVRETARVFAELGADVTLRIYRGRPHVVGTEELAEARTLLEACL